MPSDSFDRIWGQTDFSCQIVGPADINGPCPYAIQFQGWVDVQFERELAARDRLTVNRMKIYLLDRYFQYRQAVPKRHLHIGGAGMGHRCIFNVFEDTYNELRVIELGLAPPPIIDVPAVVVSPTRQAQDQGIFIGEDG